MEKRFQECNKIEKLWRYRFYLYIPLQYVFYLIRNIKSVIKPKQIYEEHMWSW